MTVAIHALVDDAPHTVIWLLSLAGLGACAAAPRPTLAAVVPSSGPVGRMHTFEVALFVRDATERELILATLLEGDLRSRGVICRVVVARSEEGPAWAADEATARASGAPFAIRVTVLNRRDQHTPVHVPELSTRRATGIAIGPTDDPAPVDFPELQPIGAREPVDLGEDAVDDDLRLEVLASLRRLDRPATVARWEVSEGTLRRLLTSAARDHRDPWMLVYRALSGRLAEQIARALAVAPGGTP